MTSKSSLERNLYFQPPNRGSAVWVPAEFRTQADIEKMEKCQSDYSNYLQAAGIQLRLVFKNYFNIVLASHWLPSRPIAWVIDTIGTLKTFYRAAEDAQEWHKVEQPRKEKKTYVF